MKKPKKMKGGNLMKLRNSEKRFQSMEKIYKRLQIMLGHGHSFRFEIDFQV